MPSHPAPVVLLVDDDPQILQLYAAFLEDRYTIRTAVSGKEALQQMDSSVEVVLLDRRMPDMNGDEVLERLREQGFDTPIALVTAVKPDFDITGLGFDEYITKPVANQELRELVQGLLTREAYDDRLKEYFTLKSKMTLLETRASPGELSQSTAYEQLSARFRSIESDAKTIIDEMSDEQLDSLYRAFDE